MGGRRGRSEGPAGSITAPESTTRSEIPAQLESPPDQQPTAPPVTTRSQELPFGQLTWENFERLCLRIARRDAEVRQCFLYGERGQEQRGIDLIGYAGELRNRETRMYQCKRENPFGAAKVKSAVDRFLLGGWDPLPRQFVLCAKVPLRSAQLQNAIQRQAARLAERGVEFIVWDSEALSEQLKGLPDLVDDFFGRGWVEAFNGPEAAASLGCRVSGPDVRRLRVRLFELYSALFARHDPGLPGPLDRRVPYRARYVNPDVSEHRVALASVPPEVIEPPSSPQTVDVRRQHPLLHREFRVEGREPILQWLPKSNRTVVLGEPGVGKSAFLRFVALSLLDPDAPEPFLAPVWGERLPVWLSFNAWTRALAINGATSIEDFLFAWLHEYSADDLRPLLADALQDHRLLLLIDGLDEQYNEAAANVALDRLDTFLLQRDVPVVLTSRPVGYERVRRPAGEWRHGRLMDFSPTQMRALAEFWFLWLSFPAYSSDAASLAAAQGAVQTQVDRFMAELQGSPRVLDLARLPLLLTLLIELSRYGARLPDHRIRAYDKMVEYMLTVHPARRQQAAGSTESLAHIAPEEVKEAMARLALRIQQAHGGGYAPIETCRDSIVEYLADQTEGPAYPLHEARAKTSQMIEEARTSLGLLVERSADELGFIHLTLQEYLAAWAVARKSDSEQDSIVAEHWADPNWREVILALVGIHGVLRRDRWRVERLVNLIRTQSRSTLDRLRQWEMLAEIVFGDLGLPPLRARAIADEVLDTIERGPFRTLNTRLARAAVRGLRSDHLREAIASRMRVWFPARDAFSRHRLIQETRNWSRSDDLRKALTVALHDEDVGCRIAAAESLSQVFAGDPSLGEELETQVRRAVRAEVQEACLIALARGWPENASVAQLTETALSNRYPGLRLSGALGRVLLGLHTERELEVLWRLGRWPSGLTHSRDDELVAGILKGWPRAEVVKQRCITTLRAARGYARSEDDLDTALAWRIVIQGFPGDPDVAALLAGEVGSKTRPFSLGFRTWDLVAEHFGGHSVLAEAVSQYLRAHWGSVPIAHFGPDEASAVVIARSEDLRDRIIQAFGEMTSTSRYWAASALTQAWPNEPQVQAFLRKQLAGPIEVASEVAPSIDSLGLSVDEQKRRLLEVVTNPQAPRVWIAFETLLKICNPPGEEILEAGIESLRTRRRGYEDESLKKLLVKAFPADERVRPLARELWRQQDTYPEFLAGIYSSDPDFRPLFLAAMHPAATAVRVAIAEGLGAAYASREIALPILTRFLHESDSTARMTAVLSLATHALQDAGTQKQLLDVLGKELKALGPNYEDRRACAVGALLRLGRYDVLRDHRQHDGAPERFRHGLEPWRPITPLIREMLRNWRGLASEFGAQLFARFTDQSDFWEAAAPCVDEFPAAAIDFQSYLREVAGTPVGRNTLDGMARLFARSDELRETCLADVEAATLQRPPDLHVFRILGIHFGGDSAVLERLRQIREVQVSAQGQRVGPSFYWQILLGLCYGWRNASEIQEWVHRPRHEWERMPWYIVFHLDRIGAQPQHLVDDLIGFLQICAEDSRVVDEQIAEAVTLWASHESHAALLTSLLKSEFASDVATAAAFLSKTGKMTTQLQRQFAELFETEVAARERPPRTGLDLSHGELRPVAEIVFEAIDGSSSQIPEGVPSV